MRMYTLSHDVWCTLGRRTLCVWGALRKLSGNRMRARINYNVWIWVNTTYDGATSAA